MVVAKRQSREKPVKIEQRKVQRLEQGPQVKQTALLASLIFIGQAQGEKNNYIYIYIYKEEPNWAGIYFSLQVFWVGLCSCLEDVFSFAF